MHFAATLSNVSVRLFITLSVMMSLMLVGVTSMDAMTDLYQLSQSSGTKTDMSSGTTQIYGASASYSSSTTTYNIGFTFYFDKVAYSTFSVNTSGLMTLGKATYPYPYCYYWPNVSTLSSYYPAIAGYWLYYGGPSSSGKVHYKVTGTAPNRVLTIEWLNVYSYNGTSTSYPGGTWQVRLYEGSNIIEYWYGSLIETNSYYATIGIAQSTSRYINVYGNSISQYYLYPSGQYYTYRYVNSYPMTANRTFQFAPCDKKLDTILGNTAQGGSAEMKNGDVLFSGKKVMRGNAQTYQPFSFKVPGNPCTPFTYKISFSGTGASDYTISPASGTVITNGMAPVVSFTPGGVGVRDAVMTMTLSTGETYNYSLQAEGLTRIQYQGDLSQGGSAAMKDGDFILSNIDVPRNTQVTLNPFTLTNINATPTASALKNAGVSLTLNDQYNQYQIGLKQGGTVTWSNDAAIENVVSTLAPGEVATVVIRVKPDANGTGRGTGYQDAALKVVADNEVRNFTVRAYSVAPSVEMKFEGKALSTSDRNLFRGKFGCVGTEAMGGLLEVENTNKVPMTINRIDVLQSDDEIKQGAAPYRFVLDEYGSPVRMADYFVATAPVVAPVQANQLAQFPMTLQPGEKRNLYLGFVSQRPERRFGRVFLYTNAVNITGKNTNAFMPTSDPNAAPENEGIVILNMYGTGIGGHLARNAQGQLNGLAMTFASPDVDQPTTAEIMIHNTGECSLLINKADLALVSGDVGDFKLLDVLPNMQVDAQGNFVIPPGRSDRIVASFRPLRSGSRRASVMLRTNDSTVIIPGATDRGIYYLDLYGVGHSYLEAKPVSLPPAVIGGSPSIGSIVLDNASTDLIQIASIALEGPSATEFAENMAKRWPGFPIMILPGQKLELSTLFVPATGSTNGMHEATVVITTTNGDVIRTPISALAGTRVIAAAPGSLFSGVSAPVGSITRRTAVVTNTGSFPVRLNSITITGVGRANYRIATSTSMDLDPGQSKFMEVVFEPKSAGSGAAQIEIQSNATAGMVTINLMGASNGTEQGNGADGASNEFRSNGNGAKQDATTGSISFSLASTLVRDVIGLSYSLPGEGQVEIGLYNVNGQLVRPILSEWGVEGRNQVQVPVSELPNGIYQVRMVQGSAVRSEIVRIVR